MKSKIIKGTFILSAAGILTRLIGFYYRIFLSNTIGAAGMGLYQMIFPMYGLCISFAVTGIQMAISKYVAAALAQKNHEGSLGILRAGLSISICLSILISFLLYLFSDFVAEDLVGDIRCTHLLKLAAYAIPCCAIHGCIIGYFLGKSQTVVPAIAQLAEQVSRVGIVYLIALLTSETRHLSPDTAMAGLLVGEFMSSVICVFAMIKEVCRIRKQTGRKPEKKNDIIRETSYRKEILVMSYPLSFGRVITSIILSFEAVLILHCLKKFGLSHDESIRIYGILTGMAMPFIFFPSTITAAISSVILPSISESQSDGNYVKIARTTSSVVRYCFSIGIFFTALFYLYGYEIGTVLFSDRDAGTFIAILSWLCPFMYLGSTLGSILNGLGLTKITFVVNVSVSLSRVLFLWFFVPLYGIRGYLWGILASQIVSAFLLLGFVKKHTHFKYNPRECILSPCFITACSIVPGLTTEFLLKHFSVIPIVSLGLSICFACGIFVWMMFYQEMKVQKK